MTCWRLVSDVGGTNVRFARAYDGEGLQCHRCYPVSLHSSFLTALKAYFNDTGAATGCGAAAIGAAGAVIDGRVSLTNAAWEIAETEVSEELGVACTLVNDVQAVAFSLPVLAAGDIDILGSVKPNLANAQRLLAANIGTGFGAATLIKSRAGWICCPSEAGHMSLAFPEPDEKNLRGQLPSVEHVLSGRGLCHLRGALANEEWNYDAAKVLREVNADPHCAEALRLFTRIAGDALGNLTLAVAAWDGVYLCGSVARAFARVADYSLFREAFESKGPMSDWMKTIPVALITNEDAALAGLAALPMDQGT